MAFVACSAGVRFRAAEVVGGQDGRRGDRLGSSAGYLTPANPELCLPRPGRSRHRPRVGSRAQRARRGVRGTWPRHSPGRFGPRWLGRTRHRHRREDAGAAEDVSAAGLVARKPRRTIGGSAQAELPIERCAPSRAPRLPSAGRDAVRGLRWRSTTRPASREGRRVELGDDAALNSVVALERRRYVPKARPSSSALSRGREDAAAGVPAQGSQR